MLDQYLKNFSGLQSDKDRKCCSALTTHQTPLSVSIVTHSHSSSGLTPDKR
jgi:hypothetical protein